MVNSSRIDRRLEALAHPVRRRMVERLARGPASVAEASRGIPVSKPAISRHLRVLEEAGVVTRVIDGRRHRLALNAAPLADTAAWLERLQELWERKFDVVDEYLRERKDA